MNIALLAAAFLAVIYLAMYIMTDIIEGLNVEIYPGWAPIVAMICFVFLIFVSFFYAYPTIIHP